MPEQLLLLQRNGLQIAWCNDIRSYKKLIPALKQYPDALILTADDDLYYPNDWIERLFTAYRKHPYELNCLRAHRIKFSDGTIAPYKSWEICLNRETSAFTTFMTGVGGTIYSRELLYKDIFEEDLFTKLCPDGDDLWFWAMAVLNRTRIRHIVPPLNKLRYVEGTQDEELPLWKKNVDRGGNDINMARLIEHYPQLSQLVMSDAQNDEQLALLQTLFPYITARFDLKNFGASTNEIEIEECSDIFAQITKPAWIVNVKGSGKVIESHAGDLTLKGKCIGDGKLEISLRGPDIRDKSNQKQVIYIDFTSFTINDKQVFNTSHTVWHNTPYKFTMNVSDGEIITVSLKWKPLNRESVIFTK